jgi:hypothetical protein
MRGPGTKSNGPLNPLNIEIGSVRSSPWFNLFVVRLMRRVYYLLLFQCQINAVSQSCLLLWSSVDSYSVGNRLQSEYIKMRALCHLIRYDFRYCFHFWHGRVKCNEVGDESKRVHVSLTIKTNTEMKIIKYLIINRITNEPYVGSRYGWT